MPPKKQAARISISHASLWTWLLCSVRYSLGRRSYITAEIAEDLLTHFHYFSRTKQLQFIEEIETELRRAEERGHTVGGEIDHDMWRRTADNLKAKLHPLEGQGD